MSAPLYQQLSEQLKSKIVAGEFRSGDRLPSENQLSSKHQMNRATVRQALNILVNDGYIEKHQGKGSIVVDRRKSLGLLSVKGFSDVVRGKKQQVKSIILIKPTRKNWPEPFSHPLPEHHKQNDCIYLKRLRCVANTPVMLEKTYLPAHHLNGFVNKDFVNDSLFDTLLVHYNISVQAVEQDIKAISANDKVIKYLPVASGSPMLQIYLKFLTSKPDFQIYSTLFCDTSNYAIGNVIER